MAKLSWMERFRQWRARFKAERRLLAPEERRAPSREVGAAKKSSDAGRRKAAFAPSPLELVADDSWAGTPALDPSLRLACSLVETHDSIQLLERASIDIGPQSAGDQFLPLHLDLKQTFDREANTALAGLGLKIPSLYLEEAQGNPELRTITARLPLQAEIRDGNALSVREKIAAIAAEPHVERLSLANPLQPSFIGDSLRDIDLPAGRHFGGAQLDGSGVIIGIIDDGCAFAHPDFLEPGTKHSRVLYLWDQTAASKPAGKGWVEPPQGCTYGAELPNIAGAAMIDAAIGRHILANGAVDQDAVYDDVGYEIAEIASHGTHVMGIAAGNGQSPMGMEGVAPNADIIFVQLPASAIVEGPAALSLCIADAAQYIFSRAQALGKSAVINISFGGYAGPHDGTSPLERGIDQLLAKPKRAVVVAAGNGFESDVHAQGKVKPTVKSTLYRWIAHPEDPSLNFMEIWYNGNTNFDLRITPPDSPNPLGPVHLGGPRFNLQRTLDQKLIGWVDHTTDPVNHDNLIAITLRPTLDDDPTLAPAPSGIWSIELENVGQHEANFHAWIERDDAGTAGGARRRQSQFHAQDADPRFTLASLATGLLTIAVGAYSSATHEVARYSACGPTRPTGAHGRTRQKPEICAPAEEDAAGRGVLSATSRRARATRMSGTSASAPHVAGTVALMFQRANATGAQSSPAHIRDAIMQGARTHSLKPNTHQEVDDTRPVKQRTVMPELTGAGKLDVPGALNHL